MSDKRDPPTFMSRLFPDVRPLPQHKQENRPLKTGRSRQHSRHNSAAEDLPSLRLAGRSEIAAEDELYYRADGVQKRLMRELKRGKMAKAGRLDLHGQTVEQAHRSCMEFIHDSQQKGLNSVLIIHGQGYRSAAGIPVLKQQIDYWLRQHKEVLAFCSSLPQDGGKGAVYVLLRKNHQSTTV